MQQKYLDQYMDLYEASNTELGTSVPALTPARCCMPSVPGRADTLHRGRLEQFVSSHTCNISVL